MKRLLILTLPALLLVSTVNNAYGDVEAAKQLLGENLPPRKIQTGTKKTIPLSRNGKICVGIVLAPKAPSVTRLAAETLQKYLSASLGGKVEIRSAAIKGETAIYVGDHAELRKLGIDPE